MSQKPSSLALTDKTASFGRGAVLLYLAVIPFPHNAALRYMAIAAMLVAVLMALWQRVPLWDSKSPILRALLLLVAVFAVASALGPTPLDNLNELRKHFQAGVLLLLLVPAFFREPRDLRLLIAVPVLFFTLRAILALGELHHFSWVVQTARLEGYGLVKGFAMDATFYAPFLVGACFLARGRMRWLAIAALLAASAPLLVIQSRAPLVAVVVAAALMVAIMRKWRLLMGGAVVSLLVFGAATALQPDLKARLQSIVSPSSYQGVMGMSGRFPIWRGVTEIAMERPLFGYGFGWKKIATVAQEAGHVERWKSRNDPFSQFQASYFALPPGSVNPHSLWFQLLFEGGMIGLAAYVGVLLVLLRQAMANMKTKSSSALVISAMVLSYLGGHIIVGMANGLWLGAGPTFALIALLEASRRGSVSPEPASGVMLPHTRR